MIYMNSTTFSTKITLKKLASCLEAMPRNLCLLLKLKNITLLEHEKAFDSVVSYNVIWFMSKGELMTYRWVDICILKN